MTDVKLDSLRQNPFSVQTPEGMSATETVDLFVNLFSEYFNVEKPGHTFVHGPRGSGKSMLFRYMEPDCQTLSKGKSLSELPYFGIYASIKATDLNLSEFARLQNKFAEVILAEHAMVIYFASKTLVSIVNAIGLKSLNGNQSQNAQQFCSSILHKLKQAGWKPASPDGEAVTLENLILVFDELYTKTVSYLRTVAFSGKDVPYTGVLLGFHDFLLLLFKDLKMLPSMPQGPVFLMIDDADNLSKKQTEILNGWVSSRHTDYVCLKISTQLNYKTYRTVNGNRIDAPHDFSEVNIGSIYTSAKDRYPNWVEQIVGKRLSKANITVSPQDFFPDDKAQEQEIEAIKKEFLQNWEKEGHGYRPEDDAYRYARPEYIRRLQGPSKQGSTYRYAGFKQMVHISSGIIREFLEAASLMYGEQKKRARDSIVTFIEPSVQHQVLKDLSDAFMMGEFDRLESDEQEDLTTIKNIQRLRNLVTTLGGMFHLILVSDAAERRVFSIALSDELDSEVKAVIKLGIQYGYFHEATIGNKEGTGRTRLYILSRRLAPHFLLDPTGFSGYKFVTNKFLREAMLWPKKTLGLLKRKSVDAVVETSQPDLFEEENLA